MSRELLKGKLGTIISNEILSGNQKGEHILTLVDDIVDEADKVNYSKCNVSEPLKSPLNETGLAFNDFQVRVIAIDVYDRLICVNSIGEMMSLNKDHVKFKAF